MPGPAGAQASATNINVCNFLLNCCSFHAIRGVFYSFAAIFNSIVKQFCVGFVQFSMQLLLPLEGTPKEINNMISVLEPSRWTTSNRKANRFGHGLICSEDVGPSKGRS